jgi:hypothetical protein
MGATPTTREAYDQLSYYTLSRQDPSFGHQLIVDAYTAQQADDTSKPIAVAFALAGLYLHNECGFTGKAVQQAHMRLAKHKSSLPFFRLPPGRGEITVTDVLRVEPGKTRDEAIELWSRTTWNALHELHEPVGDWLRTEHEL